MRAGRLQAGTTAARTAILRRILQRATTNAGAPAQSKSPQPASPPPLSQFATMVRYCEQCLLLSAMVPPAAPTASAAPPPEPEPAAPVVRVNMVDVLAEKTADGAPAGPRNFVLATTSRKTVAFCVHDEAVPGSLWTTTPVQHFGEETLADMKQHFTKTLRRGTARASGSTISIITGIKVFALTLLIKFPNFEEFPGEGFDGWIASLLEIRFPKAKAETLEQILASWPSNDEEKAIKAFRGSPEKLKLVDRFFYETREIPHLKAKFQTLHLRESFDHRAEWIKTTIGIAVDAVSEMLASSSFGPAMVFVFAYGHVNNTEEPLTEQQMRKGFSISSVTKMLEVKSFIRGTPMLDVVVRAMERDRPDIVAFPSDVPSLFAVPTIALSAAVDDFRLLERGMKSIDEQLEAKLPFRIAPKLETPLAQHRVVLQEVRDDLAAKMESLRAEMTRYDEAVASFNTLFGEPSPSEFASSIRALAVFVVEYRAARLRLFPPPPPTLPAMIAAPASNPKPTGERTVEYDSDTRKD